ncbi:unnamed protein product [Rotaria sp. Silwood1]|nr:unnamed protein product [Rotaria sp. Silwood1]CAF1605507.1 unnamed protein product [Rotaria sp. Silwood1]
MRYAGGRVMDAEDGFEAVGCCLCCAKGCPAEYTDDGVATCIKPKSYGRGTGYPWKFGDGFNDHGMYERCEADHGARNCEKSGAIVYPKCKSGFQSAGCCICSPQCPEGMNDIGISCGKSTYGRGVGASRLQCPDDKEQDAGLCYPKCQDGLNGVGPVCWQSCPASTPVSCGLICAVDQTTCAAYIGRAALAGIQIPISIITGIVRMDILAQIEAVKAALELALQLGTTPMC